MDREVERLGDDATLQGDVLRCPGTEALVDAPADRAMVVDHVVAAARPRAVEGLARLVTDADAQVTDNDVVGVGAAERRATDTDPVPRRRLPGHGQVRV